MLNAYRYGHGPLQLVFLHDWLSDCSSYDYIIPYLDPKLYSMHCIDLRGYGANKGCGGHFTIDEATNDVSLYLKQHNLKDVHLTTHSMSGLIGQNICHEIQETIKSLIAITPIPPQGSPVPEMMRGFILAAANNEDVLATQMIQFMTGQRYHAYFVEAKLKKWRECSTPEARLGYFNLFCDTDISQKVKGLSTPIFVITGKDDVETNTLSHLSDKFKSVYPNVQFFEMDCTHYPMLEKPVELAKAIHQFISKASKVP